jgi:anti-sigma regulatory factor (Ser/Thr protein kinase)
MAVERARALIVEPGDHVVSFYESESDLAATVGRYLAAALLAGEQAIVIATPAHTEAFEAELFDAGVDLHDVRQSGRLVTLDAAVMLASFMRADGVDRRAFLRVVGGAVRDAVESGRPVRAYGEMVALLWAAGNVAGAIELETLWNELGTELPFSLFCSYHQEAVSGSEHSDALHQVCHLHTSVVEASARVPEVSRDFEADPAAPGVARRWLLESLRNFGGYEAAEDNAALVVSELATNAILHGRSPFSVVVRAERSALHISVEDRAPVGPMPGADGPLAESGRGLRLVAAVSSRYGVEAVTGGGKRVWAELRV